MKISVQEKIKTTVNVVPQIYCYSTPGIDYHDGWVKIGYTERDVDERIKEQTHAAHIRATKEWQGEAFFEDEERRSFTDKHFHAYLRLRGISNEIEEGAHNEWFKTSGDASHGHFNDFKKNHGILKNLGVSPYHLRKEQADAVNKTLAYSGKTNGKEYLWNAKPRFGKTLSVYDFCLKADAKKVLIVTNRPSISNSWYDDYAKFLGTESGYAFVSETDSLRMKPLCTTRKDYVNYKSADCPKCIEFLSLQDLKGSVYFGGKINKLREIEELEWDVLVIDEAHEGVDTFKTDIAFDKIKRKFTLHLSGTPFKAIASGKFKDSAIFNWTYADEQKAKEEWNPADGENPYGNLPKLAMLTYRMSDIVQEKAKAGIDINGENYEYAFDLNEFFLTDANGRFVHDADIDSFLDALTTQTKFSFSTQKLRNELKHTFWLLKYVASAKALMKKLSVHPIFKDYKIILAAGDGRGDDDVDSSIKKSFDAVKKAIAENDKTITLSVGQLTTGVTIPEWTAVLMLSNMKSAPLYMQAAFRAQNPCLFQDGNEFRRKETAYVFDFDPARSLDLYNEFANDLYKATAGGRGTEADREENIKKLLNFMPVYGEDDDGEMIDLDAAKVLSIPRVIHSQEVVRRGFMSNFLFENIGTLFRAPQEVREILEKLTPVKKGEASVAFGSEVADELSVDENGDVQITNEVVIGTASDLFGDKVYGSIQKYVNKVVEKNADEADVIESVVTKATTELQTTAFKKLIDMAKKEYGKDITPGLEKQIERESAKHIEIEMLKVENDAKIEIEKIKIERDEKIKECKNDKEKRAIEKKAEEKTEKVIFDATEAVSQKVESLIKDTGEAIVRKVETHIKEGERDEKEEAMRDHLRGFARTIPAFLMAYGGRNIRLDNFDTWIPENVFKEVTSITLQEFRTLRDNGQVFNATVFNDSIQEFLNKKETLANYFDENQKEDIFDYIPPQKTNQIFTPKEVVREMVDLYEKENPGCFDNPDLTYADLYVKSGLFLAEIVKRLYKSNKMKRHYPDDRKRLKHIFEKQIFGRAPSEITLRIAVTFLLGFDETNKEMKHNLKVGLLVT